MVAYQPPDRVLLMIGATFRAVPLRQAGLRLLPLLARDLAGLARHDISETCEAEIRQLLSDVEQLIKDPTLKKHDTPLPMAEVQETMSRARVWLVELRQLGALNLALDAPSLARVSSSAPEIADGYARDLLTELDLRLSAARDLRPRLEDVGVSERFLGEGTKLSQQLRTAIGKIDLDGGNLGFKTRRLYMKKAALFMLIKRVARAGRYVYRGQPERLAEYHLDELEAPPAPPKRTPA